jgi:hypothetical protein
MGELHIVRTDMYGKYELTGLAPGTYRIVSTFEYSTPESMDFDEMRAKTVVVDEGRDRQEDLDLFVIR